MLKLWIRNLFRRLKSILQLHKTIPLLWNLVLDREVSPLRKILFFGLGLFYTFLPADVVVDWIPFLGQVDDLTVWLILAERFIVGVHPNIRSKYTKPYS